MRRMHKPDLADRIVEPPPLPVVPAQAGTPFARAAVSNGVPACAGATGLPRPPPAAAQARLDAVRPDAYARTRNALDGAVTGLSPYLTHGFLDLAGVLEQVNARHALDIQHKFVYELGWRAFFRHVWQHRGRQIFSSLHAGPLPDHAYLKTLPDDIRTGTTGLPVIDQAVRTLYATGALHNHARMWLSSYTVHLRKVHWRAGADWMYAHLLDGDLASNHLSWQWVAGTGSSKPYLFNADNVARFAPPAWPSPGSVIDTSYAALDAMARSPASVPVPLQRGAPATATPLLMNGPPRALGAMPPDAARVAGRDVWLVHPWSLGDLPPDLPADTLVLGLFLSDFHRLWPWSRVRWQFVGERMSSLCAVLWQGNAATVRAALRAARRVRTLDEPHLRPWLGQLAACQAPPPLFPDVPQPCTSFSQWWRRATHGLGTADDLLSRPSPKELNHE